MVFSSSEDRLLSKVAPLKSSLLRYWDGLLFFLCLQMDIQRYDGDFKKRLHRAAKVTTDLEVINTLQELAKHSAKKSKSFLVNTKLKPYYQLFIDFEKTPLKDLPSRIEQWCLAQLLEDSKITSQQMMIQFIRWQSEKDLNKKTKARAELILMLTAKKVVSLHYVFSFFHAENHSIYSTRRLLFTDECFQVLLDALNFEFSKIAELTLGETNPYTNQENPTAFLQLTKFIAGLKQQSHLEKLSLSFFCFQTQRQAQLLISALKQKNNLLISLDLEINNEATDKLESIRLALKEAPLPCVERLRLTFCNEPVVAEPEIPLCLIEALETNYVLKVLVFQNKPEIKNNISLESARRIEQLLRVNGSLEKLDIGIKKKQPPEIREELQKINEYLDRNRHNNFRKSSVYTLAGLISHTLLYSKQQNTAANSQETELFYSYQGRL